MSEEERGRDPHLLELRRRYGRERSDMIGIVVKLDFRVVKALLRIFGSRKEDRS